MPGAPLLNRRGRRRTVPVVLRLSVAGILGCAALWCGCTQEQVAAECPSLSVGDLVVTEIRGDQNGTYGEWIELANTRSSTIDLRGLQLRIRQLDGGGADTMIIRRSLIVAANDHVVLGAFPDDARPAHVDYGWHPDLLQSGGAIKHLYDGAALDVTACDLTIDRVVWNDLPSQGSYSLGVMPPSAAGNDAIAAWCTDAIDDDPIAPGLPGTPGVSNHPCP
jgi:hypothetical protein